MTLTNAEQIKVKQIVNPPAVKVAELVSLMTAIVDPDLLAAVRASLAEWDAVKLARNPRQAGMTRADVVEWDSKSRCHELCQMEEGIRSNLKIAIGWITEEVYSF